jgi:hypothetical protein
MSTLFLAAANGATLTNGHAAPTITAEVIGHEEEEGAAVGSPGSAGGAGLYWTVQVSTSHDGFNAYRIRRRYRHFDALNAQLKAAFNGVPELPGKAGFMRDKNFLEKRRAGLTTYLRALTLDPILSQHEDVRLECPPPSPMPCTLAPPRPSSPFRMCARRRYTRVQSESVTLPTIRKSCSHGVRCAERHGSSEIGPCLE